MAKSKHGNQKCRVEMLCTSDMTELAMSLALHVREGGQVWQWTAVTTDSRDNGQPRAPRCLTQLLSGIQPFIGSKLLTQHIYHLRWWYSYKLCWLRSGNAICSPVLLFDDVIIMVYTANLVIVQLYKIYIERWKLSVKALKGRRFVYWQIFLIQ